MEKEYTLLISNYIYNQLQERGYKVFLTRGGDEYLSVDDRIELIKDKYGSSSDVIVVSSQLSDELDGINIIYALRNTSTLSLNIADFLSDAGFAITDYFQRRDPIDTNLDYDQIIRDSNNNESLIISFGNVNNINDVNLIKNNWQAIAEAIVKAIVIYSGGNYVDEGYYTVVEGDSLYSIARKFNTTVDTLKSVNNLTSNILTIGQLLKIPASGESEEGSSSGSSQDYFQYTVKSGDTLYSIARKYEISVNQLKEFNNLVSNSLSVGQTLKIPNSSSSTDTGTGVQYIVVSGDSLYSIAKKYNTTVDEIKKLNNLSGNNLSIGQILKIPTSTNETTSYLTYVVKSGDSLYNLALKYGTTVDEIKRINNLTSNSLSIGQTLKIPNTNSLNYFNYTVVSGDSLYVIAQRFNTTVDQIKRLNNLTSNNLSIGQILKIPK